MLKDAAWCCQEQNPPERPTLKVLSRSEALVRGNHGSLFDGDSPRHTDETRLEICKFEDIGNKHQLRHLHPDVGPRQGQTE